MKLGARIFVSYLVIFAACFYIPMQWTIDSLDTRYRESVEEIMVDHATVSAVQIAGQMQQGTFDPQQFADAFRLARQQPLMAQIYGLTKDFVDTDFYLTDARGFVISDSREPSAIGSDYAQWRDVALTLSDEYGARTTRRDPLDPTSSSLYVGAPVRVEGKIVGCFTLIKPTSSINAFIAQAKPRVIRAGLLSLAAAALLSYLFSIWLTRPISRLIAYANGISEGRGASYPDLGRSEIADLGDAMQKMQIALEGKQYVEEYVQNLTHEIKSPLSAIRGAAELIDEQMPLEKQQRFLANIRSESARISRIVDTMLELAALENRRFQPDREPVDLQALLNNVIESKGPMLAQKGIEVDLSGSETVAFAGNRFLLHQAISNLVQNAIDFSPAQSRIAISAHFANGQVGIVISDQGAGIPDYAVDRVFEKFYSLKRPDTGRKSTGLGLNFVREVAHAHGGEVSLNRAERGGTEAQFILPLSGPANEC